MLRIENVGCWTAERLDAAMPSIRACIQRVVDEEPDALTVEWVFGEVAAGHRQMWIVFDEEAPAVAVMVGTSEFRHYYATGHRFIEFAGLGGERLAEAWPLVEDIYVWGRLYGVRDFRVKGRKGWERHLRKRGYVLKSVTLKLAL